MQKFIRDVFTVSYFVTGCLWKFVTGDGNTVSFFATGYGSLYERYTGFHTLDVEVYKRRIHCFILCNWSWKIIRDVYTVSYFVTWMWKFIKDVYTISYFVPGCRSL